MECNIQDAKGSNQFFSSNNSSNRFSVDEVDGVLPRWIARPLSRLRNLSGQSIGSKGSNVTDSGPMDRKASLN